MKRIQARALGKVSGLDLSEKALQEHHRLYQGYVKKYNDLREKLEMLRANRGIGGSDEAQGLKFDLAYALGAVKNHELFFDILGRVDGGEDVTEPQGELRKAIEREFGSLPKFLVDLKQTALSGGGWAWTTVDLDFGYLFNYGGTRQHTLPVWNAVPIIAVDLYVHSFAQDFDDNKGAYIDAVLDSLNWERVAKRFNRAMGRVESPEGQG